MKYPRLYRSFDLLSRIMAIVAVIAMCRSRLDLAAMGYSAAAWLAVEREASK